MTGCGPAEEPPVVLGESDRAQPAGRVFALVLDGLLDTFRSLEPAVLASADPDALHDYRVTLRRTRSILAAGSDVYPSEELALLAALTAGLAEVTSPVRDLDVLLGSFERYRSWLSPALADGADLLRGALLIAHADARRALLDQIASGTHPVLLRRWQVMASVHRVGGSDPGPDALRPAGAVVDELVDRAYRHAVRGAADLLASEDRADWHTLRKRLKKLRYLVGAFAPLYPDDAFAPLMRELPILQDRFGVLQDHLVHADLIEDAGLRVGGRGTLAAGAIADRLHHQIGRDVGRCRKRIPRLGSKEVRRSMRRALRRR